MKYEVLPTNGAIWNRTRAESGSCPAYGVEEETLFHAFYECPNAKTLAFGSQWGIKIENYEFMNFKQIISFIINPSVELISLAFTIEKFMVLLISMFYLISNRRNESIFNPYSTAL